MQRPAYRSSVLNRAEKKASAALLEIPEPFRSAARVPVSGCLLVPFKPSTERSEWLDPCFPSKGYRGTVDDVNGRIGIQRLEATASIREVFVSIRAAEILTGPTGLCRTRTSFASIQVDGGLRKRFRSRRDKTAVPFTHLRTGQGSSRSGLSCCLGSRRHRCPAGIENSRRLIGLRLLLIFTNDPEGLRLDFPAGNPEIHVERRKGSL